MTITATRPFVSHAREGNVGIVTLRRPPQNRLTRELFTDLGDAVTQLARAGVRALLIRGDGPDFCLGGEFREWESLTSHLARRERFGFSNGVLNMIESLPIPTVTAVHGRAFGGGFELALHTDVIAADPGCGFTQGLGHGFGRGGAVQRYLPGDQGLAFPGRIGPAGQAAAREQRHGVVAVHPLGLGHIGLDAVLEAEHLPGPLAVPDQ